MAGARLSKAAAGRRPFMLRKALVSGRAALWFAQAATEEGEAEPTSRCEGQEALPEATRGVGAATRSVNA